MELLELLSWFPSLSTDLICEIFEQCKKADIVRDVWELNAFSLTTQIEGGYYALPAVISARFRRGSARKVGAVWKSSVVLKQNFESDVISIELISSLIVGIVALQGQIPDFVKGIITASTLLNVVEEEYRLGLGSDGTDANEHFRRAYEISHLAINLQATDDTLDNIMFYGADAAVRTGVFPGELIAAMRKRGFASVHHIEGSYLFDHDRDYEGAGGKIRTGN